MGEPGMNVRVVHKHAPYAVQTMHKCQYIQQSHNHSPAGPSKSPSTTDCVLTDAYLCLIKSLGVNCIVNISRQEAFTCNYTFVVS
jgi:hypothetical protein